MIERVFRNALLIILYLSKRLSLRLRLSNDAPKRRDKIYSALFLLRENKVHFTGKTWFSQPFATHSEIDSHPSINHLAPQHFSCLALR